MKKIKWIFAAGILSFGHILMAQRDPQALEVLEKMSAKYQAIQAYSAAFSQTLENKMEDISDSFDGSIVVKDEKFYLDLGDQVIINDGKTVWTYLAEANEVTIDHYYPESGDMNPTKIYTSYKEGYKYRYLAGEGAAKYHIVELEPEDKDSPFFKVRMRIKKTDNLLESWEVYDRAGNIFSYEIKNFKERKDINDSYFKFDKSRYPGVEVLDFR